jgi:DNA-binding NtrC family response regulator
MICEEFTGCRNSRESSLESHQQISFPDNPEGISHRERQSRGTFVADLLLVIWFARPDASPNLAAFFHRQLAMPMPSKFDHPLATDPDMRILVAESDHERREKLCEEIGSWGFVAQGAEIGEALERARAVNPDVLLLGFQGPENDGAELMRQMHASGLKIPTIVMGEKQDLDSIVQSVQFDAYDFISRPVNPIHLRIMLNNLGAQLNAIRENERMRRQLLSAEDLPNEIRRAGRKGPQFDLRVGDSLDDVERELIFRTLDFTNGNKVRAAKILGISLKTIYNRLVRYHGKDRDSVGESSHHQN